MFFQMVQISEKISNVCTEENPRVSRPPVEAMWLRQRTQRPGCSKALAAGRLSAELLLGCETQASPGLVPRDPRGGSAPGQSTRWRVPGCTRILPNRLPSSRGIP